MEFGSKVGRISSKMLENNVLVHASRLESLAEGKNVQATVGQQVGNSLLFVCLVGWLVAWLLGCLVLAWFLLGSCLVLAWFLLARAGVQPLIPVALFFVYSVGVVGTGRDGRDSFGFKTFRSDVCVLFGRSET